MRTTRLTFAAALAFAAVSASLDAQARMTVTPIVRATRPATNWLQVTMYGQPGGFAMLMTSTGGTVQPIRTPYGNLELNPMGLTVLWTGQVSMSGTAQVVIPLPDTLVLRNLPLQGGVTVNPIIPIELTQLSLVSCQPIVPPANAALTYNKTTRAWGAGVTGLAPAAPVIVQVVPAGGGAPVVLKNGQADPTGNYTDSDAVPAAIPAGSKIQVISGGVVIVELVM